MIERVAVEARGVSKCFGVHHALAAVDLEVPRGQVHGLLGPNGAGKTTLLRVLLGLVRRDAGHVRLLERDLDDGRGGVPEGVAGTVETPAFYPYLSARKNLELLARLDDRARQAGAKRVNAVLERVDLRRHAEISVARYSAGMRQRLGLAAALLRSPRLLLLDEPTSALDPAAAHSVRALVRELAGEGTAVLFSSHDMDEVEELCSTLTVINRGRVVFTGSADALRARAPGALHTIRTSDHVAALDLARQSPNLNVTSIHDGGLEVSAETEALDEFVIALGRRGVAVRMLERRTRSLESLFLDLTSTRGATASERHRNPADPETALVIS